MPLGSWVTVSSQRGEKMAAVRQQARWRPDISYDHLLPEVSLRIRSIRADVGGRVSRSRRPAEKLYNEGCTFVPIHIST